jgi:hypothetical protein
MNPETVLRELRAAHLADNGVLTPADRSAVQQTLARLTPQGLQAYVVVLPQSEDVQTWRKLWGLLALQEAHDLLLLYNGRRWEARGWGLAPPVIGRVLDQAENALKHSPGSGLVTALSALAEQAAPQTTADRPRPAGAPAQTRSPDHVGPALRWLGVGGGGLVLLGGVGWLLYRRRRLQQHQEQAFNEVCAAAEAAFTQVMLADDTLDGQIRDLQLQATTQKQYLEQVIESVKQGQRAMGDPVLIGEITQIANQFATIHSAILRRQKELSPC